MTEATDALVLDLVEWIGREPRLYSAVIETWRTSCPRLTIWEDAVERGYVRRAVESGVAVVRVTPAGLELLREHSRGTPAALAAEIESPTRPGGAQITPNPRPTNPSAVSSAQNTPLPSKMGGAK